MPPPATPHKRNITPLRIVLAYVVAASLWIGLSDHALALLISDPHLLSEAQTLKGLFFITITGLFLYVLMSRAMTALRNSEERFRGIIENAPFGVHLYRLDADDRLVFIGANRAANRILGVDNARFIGMELLEAFPALRGTPVPEAYRKVCRTGEVWSEQQVFYEDERIKGAFEVHAFASAPGTMASIFVDVTERTRLEMARREMDRVKDGMISSVSHEMRTPLTAMLGYLEFMHSNELPVEQRREFLETVLRETERLNQLIGNFLDFQRLRAGQTPLRIAPVPVVSLLQDVQHLFSHCPTQNRVTLQVGDDLPSIAGDYEQVRQVLNNLVSNAIKYSPEGSEIFLGAREDDGAVLLWVRDQGIGIKPEDQEQIFQTFFRVDNSDTRAVGGTGLGLALVREIVHLHRGRVWVDSMPGQGSTFWVRFPAAMPGRM